MTPDPYAPQPTPPKHESYRLVSAFVFLAAGILVLGVMSWFRTAGPDLVPWRQDFDAAKAEAAQAGKPLFLDFTAEWCGPCQDLKRTTWSDHRVADAISSTYIPVRIDVDRQPGLTRQYHVEGYPTLIVLDEQGRVARAHVGWVGPDDFLAWLNG